MKSKMFKKVKLTMLKFIYLQLTIEITGMQLQASKTITSRKYAYRILKHYIANSIKINKSFCLIQNWRF